MRLARLEAARRFGRPLTAALLLAGAFCAAAAERTAEGYPVRPVRFVVSQSPGGANDLTARVVAQLLSERVGQPVIVENRPGAGSIIGTDLVAKATPDGYTLLVTSSSITIIPSMYKKVPFDTVRDFAGVTTLSSYPFLLVVPPSMQVDSVKQLIVLSKAKPGGFNYASGGTGTPTHLGAELFKSVTGINIVHVPYKGGGEAINAVLGGHVQLYVGPIGTVVSHVKAGRLKALAVTSLKRSPVVPELPTVAEAGLPGSEHTVWNGVLAPARTPPAIIKKLNTEVAAILKTSTMRDRFAAEGVEPGGITPEELGAFIRCEIAKWARITSEAGIKPE